MTADQLLEYLEKTCAPMELRDEDLDVAVEKLARQIDEEMMVLARVESGRFVSGKGKKCS